MARMELADAIPFLGQIYRGKYKTASMSTRVKAVDTLVRIGVPQQVEQMPLWDGDWSIFAADELDRIQAGEHPQRVLESRAARAMADSPPVQALPQLPPPEEP